MTLLIKRNTTIPMKKSEGYEETKDGWEQCEEKRTDKMRGGETSTHARDA